MAYGATASGIGDCSAVSKNQSSLSWSSPSGTVQPYVLTETAHLQAAHQFPQLFLSPVGRGVVDKDVAVIDRLVRQRGGDALREHADICDLVEAGGENGKRAM